MRYISLKTNPFMNVYLMDDYNHFSLKLYIQSITHVKLMSANTVWSFFTSKLKAYFQYNVINEVSSIQIYVLVSSIAC